MSTTTNKPDFWHEVATPDCDRLETLGEAIWPHHPSGPVRDRYNFYRRKGYSAAASLQYVYAWAHNVGEQKARRLAHDTGAGGVL